ncbi:MAG: gamma-glutamyltransferase, partial [Pseudomonadota bacterium]
MNAASAILGRLMQCVTLTITIFLVASCSHGLSGKSDFSSTIDSEAVVAAGAAAPEAASGFADKPGWATRRFAVAAANPLAAQAGYQVLKAGGSAVDAAIAVQMVLTLVEPQSSGIGGGAFLLHHDGRTVEAFDGRETAPAGANGNLFVLPDGKPMPFADAVAGGRAVGVPGAVAMLEMAHRQHGRLPWAALFEPAIRLADEGFRVSPRLHTLLQAEQANAAARMNERARRYFFQPDGNPWPVGHRLQNPALAEALRAIARDGSRALKQGPIAQAMVDVVHQHPRNPGTLSLQDLASYQALRREPLCFDHPAPRARVCGFPPPSSGGLAVAQILGLLARTPAATLELEQGLPSAQWLHLYLEAARLAFADRAQYVADPAFVAPPAPAGWQSLIAPTYLANRSRLIDTRPGAASLQQAQPGQPAALPLSHFAPMPSQPEYGTSHISIVDGQGNALAMTTTIEDQFGARQMVKGFLLKSGGFLLNNQLTDFSFLPQDAQGRPIANRVQPGKRPRSSMAPTLVLDPTSGQVMMSLGIPGGAAIIHYTA